MKLPKKLSPLSFLGVVAVITIASVYFLLLNDGRETYYSTVKQVNKMIEREPTFFTTIFNDIFPFALECSVSKSECISQTRQKLDFISVSPLDYATDYDPSNKHPMYFIKLLPDGKIAKLFFSGDLEIEEINTREERMVVALLEGKRDALYGPYYDQELTGDGKTPNHALFDLKPAYLKDLYSQMEIVIPYHSNSEIVGGIVYLHGE